MTWHGTQHSALDCASESGLLCLQKPSRSTADPELPPHLANRPALSSQGTASKPPSSHPPSGATRYTSSKPSVLPIPALERPSSSSKGKTPYEQAAGRGHARLDEEDPAASSRTSTPGRKAKQRSQEGQGLQAKPEPLAPPAVVRKVVPLTLVRNYRQGDSQAAPLQGSGALDQHPGQARQTTGSNDAQVWLLNVIWQLTWQVNVYAQGVALHLIFVFLNVFAPAFDPASDLCDTVSSLGLASDVCMKIPAPELALHLIFVM